MNVGVIPPYMREGGQKKPVIQAPKTELKRNVGGGRAFAKPKANKPGNMASVDKTRKRIEKQAKRTTGKKRG